MNEPISNLDLAMWVVFTAGQVFLCVCIIRRKITRRLPWFSAYIFAVTAETLIQLALLRWGSYAAYYYAFYASSFIVAALALFSLVECGLQVLPGLDLPKKDKARLWLIGVVAAAVTFAALWPLRYIENRVEVGAYLAIAATATVIAIYARYLGLYWSQLLAGVSFTLGFRYLVGGATRAILWHAPVSFALQLRIADQVANILAVIAWIIVILMPWGEYDPTEEELAQAKQIVDDIEDNLRHVAAGGRE
jgi:hypothetical protein